MITIHNYFQEIKKIDLGKLAPKFKQVHDLIVEATDNGASWEEYHESEPTKQLIDSYLLELNREFAVQARQKDRDDAQAKGKEFLEQEKKRIDQIQKQNPGRVIVAKPALHDKEAHKPAAASEEKTATHKTNMRVAKGASDRVERISEELRFIKRFVNLEEKHKLPKHILSFINGLQRAIAEKRIRKTSPFAKEVSEVQDMLISMYHKHMHQPNKEFKVKIEPSKLAKLASITGKQEVMPSVRLIKAFIGMQGKLVTNERAKTLYNRIVRSLQNKTIKPSDPYYDLVVQMEGEIKVFVQKNPQSGYLIIHPRTLNGLNNILCDGDPFLQYKNERGYDEIPRHTVINSMDLDKLTFETYQFTGKWHEFFGNPSRGFSMMVTSHPKYGKSTMCIEFAHYLASHHGSVLYVAQEEGIGETIREKFDRLNAKHPNLSVVDEFDEKLLGKYEFVFLDSVSRMNLTPEQLLQLKRKYPNISFIYVFQVTKAGVFRGSKSFEHNVDMVVVFPKFGHAKQYGRFNQGGEMTLFKQNLN